ncbi:recombinase family protein [Pseudarthrobacter sulfonivorans]|uniref:recombinase family protein n=1 Tax=Pseudarthrobacter sulfonivorans TaxID=121292 RepID=UPI001CC32440|nr:recombinase family protein [Pseudarthrobacter sulfonivorans]
MGSATAEPKCLRRIFRTASRPELDQMLEHLPDGDKVVLWQLDRLGRNTFNLPTLIDDLEHRGSTSAASRTWPD